jgi:hypothetical protein
VTVIVLLLSVSMPTVASVLYSIAFNTACALMYSCWSLDMLLTLLLLLLLLCVCHCVCNSLDAFIVLSGAVLTAYVGITGLIRRMAKVSHAHFVPYSTLCV